MMALTAVKAPTPLQSFEALYDAHARFVWRALARLGVATASLDDAVQEVFIVAHRQLADFEGRSTVRTWLAAITLRVASTWRRTTQRRGEEALLGEPPAPGSAISPDDAAARTEGLAILRQILDGLPEEQQQVFVLMELEQHTAPEVAEVLNVALNTVYSRLRLARAAFNLAVERLPKEHP